MIVRLPHSLAPSRHVPVLGLPPLGWLESGVQVATSSVEVIMTGLSLVPFTKIFAPRATARLPPSSGSLATTVPASTVKVAPDRTYICFFSLYTLSAVHVVEAAIFFSTFTVAAPAVPAMKRAISTPNTVFLMFFIFIFSFIPLLLLTIFKQTLRSVRPNFIHFYNIIQQLLSCVLCLYDLFLTIL